jgi:hypothetical protein
MGMGGRRFWWPAYKDLVDGMVLVDHKSRRDFVAGQRSPLLEI